jgi:hypothetical protein
MGSITRVNVSYVNLKLFLQNTSLPIFGTFMDGSNVYKENLPKQAVVIMGNEANGISQEIENSIKKFEMFSAPNWKPSWKITLVHRKVKHINYMSLQKSV